MLYLEIYRENRFETRFAVEGGRCRIGRSKTADLTLDDPEVSRNHTILTERNGQWFVQDDASRNGTVLNGQILIGEKPLTTGDTLKIGSSRLTVEISGEDRQASSSGDADDKTQFFPAREYLDENVRKRKRQMEQRARDMRKVEAGMRYTLRCTKGRLKGEEFPVTKEGAVIGRSESCAIQLPDEAVSSEHTRIYVRDRELHVEDLNSLNGTYVNGRRYQEKPLKNGDRLVIGGNAFTVGVVNTIRRKKIILYSSAAIALFLTIKFVVGALKPPPPELPYVEAAEQSYRQGLYKEALHHANRAMEKNPKNKRAGEIVALSESALKVASQLTDAEQRARSGRFDEAKDIVTRVIQEDERNPKALELADVLKDQSYARQAYEARNWKEAAGLYRRLINKYPEYSFLQEKMNISLREQQAKESVEAAEISLSQGDYAAARKVLDLVDHETTYADRKQELLAALRDAEDIQGEMEQAKALFREGDLDGARASCDRARMMDPDHPEVKAILSRIDELAPLMEMTNKASSILAAAKIDEMAALRDDMQTLQRLTLDLPDSPYQGESTRWLSRLQTRLDAVARDAMNEGERLILEGRLREGIAKLDISLRANPSNVAARGRMDDAWRRLNLECSKLYERARIEKDIGRHGHARDLCRQILSITMSGDEYNVKARGMLDTLPETGRF
jgi:pSer/pThr/pTyr-binding forkhead associated (FHA) protein/outer membrane protein assembly factor BamD (BamD/ComL family)